MCLDASWLARGKPARLLSPFHNHPSCLNYIPKYSIVKTSQKKLMAIQTPSKILKQTWTNQIGEVLKDQDHGHIPSIFSSYPNFRWWNPHVSSPNMVTISAAEFRFFRPNLGASEVGLRCCNWSRSSLSAARSWEAQPSKRWYDMCITRWERWYENLSFTEYKWDKPMT